MGRTVRAFGFLSLFATGLCIHAAAQKLPVKKVPSTAAADDESSPMARLVTSVSRSVISIDSTGAMNDLKALPWFSHPVREIRAFRLEGNSDFTTLMKDQTKTVHV